MVKINIPTLSLYSSNPNDSIKASCKWFLSRREFRNDIGLGILIGIMPYALYITLDGYLVEGSFYVGSKVDRPAAIVQY